ncbi:polysaccharide pyruvyl transferase family protein [Faecalimonas sp. LCP19S3_D12]
MNNFKIYIKQIIKIIMTFIEGNYIYICRHFKGDLDSKKKYAIIFFAADYNNLGDIAITIAQEEFLKKCLGDEYQIVKIKESQVYSAARAIKKLNKNNVIITLIGGGNNGSLYEFIEGPRRFLLWKFKDYKIVSFPQTVTFENTVKAIPYEKSFARLCNRCSNLVLVAREKKSYDKYKEIQKSKVLLTPDVVFYLDNNKEHILKSNNDVAFIMRNDKEKAIDSTTQNLLLNLTKQKNRKIYFWDTCDVEYAEDNTKQLLENYLSNLRKVKFVVTDRLHGMILCYIARTPCIVIDNNNGKIRATYETWLTNQNFIRLYNHKEGTKKYMELMEYMGGLKSAYTQELGSAFNPLRDILEEMLGKCRK